VPGNRQRAPTEKGTAASNIHKKTTVETSLTRRGRTRWVSLGQLAESAKEGLLALAVGRWVAGRSYRR
jgi:hypothetical protein